MAITAITGPHVVFGITQTSTGGVQEYNGQAGPSLFYQGVAIADLRPFYAYQPGNEVTADVFGWHGDDKIMVIDQVPTTAGENTIALTQSATTTTTRTLTLTTSNTANATVGVSITAPESGQTVTGLIAIDGATGTVTYGSDGTIALWNPGTTIARTVRIEGSSDDSGGAFTINGRDVYGYLMSETITGSISTTAGSTFVSTRKAFKYITSITASGTVNSTGITIGVTDTYGLPLAIQTGIQVLVGISSGTLVTPLGVSSGFTVASTVATQTSTTPDVRGTWASSGTGLNADGTRRLTVFITPSPAAMASTGFFGATQFSTAS